MTTTRVRADRDRGERAGAHRMCERRVERGREIRDGGGDGRREDAGARDVRKRERAGAVAEEDGHLGIVRSSRA